ncbi:MAG: transglutaminase domain-containing protein, partial [Planctomycetaceae bacterium]
DDRGLQFMPDRIGEALAYFDLLVVPGGHIVRELQYDASFIHWLQTASAVPLKASVCTGSLLLGAAGFLAGSAATTHWSALEELRRYTADVRTERVVDTGNVVTAGGVTAGIDLGLHLVERLAGRDARIRMARQMDYLGDSTNEILRVYLQASDIVDFDLHDVKVLAESLREFSPMATAKRCFEWVRDEIRHSLDHGDEQVTLKASEVLRERTGLCYAKSHLLAALLRANGIPCGFVYQRLALDDAGTAFCLHGLNALWLPGHGWYRFDPRGNRPGVNSQFNPPRECLAFETNLLGEGISDHVFADPLPVVVAALRQSTSMTDLSSNLPDFDVRLISDKRGCP